MTMPNMFNDKIFIENPINSKGKKTFSEIVPFEGGLMKTNGVECGETNGVECGEMKEVSVEEFFGVAPPKSEPINWDMAPGQTEKVVPLPYDLYIQYMNDKLQEDLAAHPGQYWCPGKSYMTPWNAEMTMTITRKSTD